MAIERKPVQIHYRKFDRPSGEKSSLEMLIRQAMDSPEPSGKKIRQRYLARLLTVDSNNYFINTYSDGREGVPLVFGDILHFTKGHLQALCKTANEDAPHVPVQQMQAPEQSEYVHSQMFWMVKNDHVFVLQSLSLKTTELEQYFEWLLKKLTNQMQSHHQVLLHAKFDADAIGGDLGDIQEIIVGGVASQPPTMPDNDSTESSVVEEKESVVTQKGQIDTGRRTGWAAAREILSVLLNGEANVEQLMQSVPADAELNVQVHIGFQTKKRKVDRVALRQLETGLRHLPDSQLHIKAKGAKQAPDGSIRLHHPASIRLITVGPEDNKITGSLLDPSDVLRAMHEAFRNFVDNGKIQEK